MAKKTNQSDEEIIDLTELIEPGHAPASQPRASAGGFEDLLAQADAGDMPRPSAKQGASVDPHEELDMLNMGDIDNLLETLDIPAQPRESGASAPGKGAPGLDDALDGLLGGDDGGAQKNAASDSSFARDLDAILGDDLDAPPPAPGGPAPAAPPAPPKTPDPDDDLDALLGDIGIPPKDPGPGPGRDLPPAAEKSAPPKAAPAIDMDAEMDDLLGSFDSEAAKPAAPKAPAPDASLDADLDDILSAVDAPAPPKAGQKKTAPDASEELDDILDAPAKTPQPSRVVSRTMDETPAFLDRGQQGVSPEVIADICQNIMAARDSGDSGALTDFSRQLGEQTANMENLVRQTGELGKRLSACENRVGECMARIARLEKGVEAAATIEDLLKDGAQLHEGFKTLIASAVSNAMQGFSARQGVSPELLDRFARVDADSREADERIGLLESRINNLEAGSASPNSIALAELENFENRLAVLEANAQAVPAPRGDDADARIARLAGRLDAFEKNAELQRQTENQHVSASLEAFENRLAALEAGAQRNTETAAAETNARIDQLAGRLDEFEAKAASEGLPPDALKKMGQLESGAKGADARIALLEKRLDELEPNFNMQVEKAAASAAARILHEEIGKLLGSQ